MLVRESDLTSVARIRNAALEGFARNGVAATSIRDVASAAGVSPGLIQHHFTTKAALREAVNEYVIEVVTDAFDDLGSENSSADLLEEIGNRITAVFRDHEMALLYVARSVAEGDEAALQIFDAFMEIADTQTARLAKAGLLHPDLDLGWAALHPVVINLGTALLEPAISRHLPEPFHSPEQLDRWNQASTGLFRRGIFRPAPTKRKGVKRTASRSGPPARRRSSR